MKKRKSEYDQETMKDHIVFFSQLLLPIHAIIFALYDLFFISFRLVPHLCSQGFDEQCDINIFGYLISSDAAWFGLVTLLLLGKVSLGMSAFSRWKKSLFLNRVLSILLLINITFYGVIILETYSVSSVGWKLYYFFITIYAACFLINNKTFKLMRKI